MDRAFVGRAQEMEQLSNSLEYSMDGQPHLTMLAGEPGIGKTRLSQEISSYAESRGTRVLRGRCYEDLGTPPYWPSVQAVASYVRDCDSERLRSEMGAGASDIAEIVPDLWAKLPGLEPPVTLEPEQARIRLFDSIVAFLKTASRAQPIMLVFDNLHWADTSSLLLLEFASHEIVDAPIFTVGTFRDTEVSLDHPLSHLLGELTKEANFQHMQLSGLTQDDVSIMIEVMSGTKLPRSLANQIHRRTGGNPLFLTEVIRLLEPEITTEEGYEAGLVQTPEGPWSVKIPAGVGEAIATRLSRMSEECNRVLTVGSVIGRAFDLDFLKQLLSEMILDHLLEALDEASSVRIIEEIPNVLGRYQFSHALIQESLRERLSSSNRARLHARIGQILETRPEDQLGFRSAELAFHFTEAEPILGPGKMVEYSLMAGESALATYAFGEALIQFRSVLSAKTNLPEDSETAAALFGLARAQEATLPRQQLGAAFDSMSRAFDIYAAMGNGSGAVRVAEFALVQAWERNDGVELIDRAL